MGDKEGTSVMKPPDCWDELSYEEWKKEIEIWDIVTGMAKKQRGPAVAFTLPKGSTIRRQVFSEVTKEEMSSETGLKTLLEFMDGKLMRDEMEVMLEYYDKFKNCKRENDGDITAYIDDFDEKYNQLKRKGTVLPQEILSFELIGNAFITESQRLMVLSGVDYKQKTTMYEQTKKALKKFLTNMGSEQHQAVKLEPTFLAENEEALAAAGYYRRGFPGRGGNNRGYGWRKGRGRSWGGRNKTDFTRPMNPKDGTTRHMNPKDGEGNTLKCRACGSFRHLLQDCPDSYENMEKHKDGGEGEAYYTAEEVVIMYTGYNKSEIERLGEETRNCAVLDTACTSTVCGNRWLTGFMDTLTEEERENVLVEAGEKKNSSLAVANV